MPESGNQAGKTISLKSDFAESANAHELRSKAIVANTAPENATSFILSGTQQVAREASISLDNRKKRSENARFTRSVLDILNERLAELDKHIADISTEIQRINDRRIAIGDELHALQELEDLLAAGDLDRRNPEHNAIMKKASVHPDASLSYVEAFIAAQRIALTQEDEMLENEGNVLIKRRDELEREREDVLTAKAEIENATTPEKRVAADEAARAMLDAKQLIDLAVQSEDIDLKAMTAEAVAKSDGGADDTNANADHTRKAAQEYKQAIYQSDASGFTFS